MSKKLKNITEYPAFSNDEKGPNPIDVHVGKRLRERRIQMGMSQETIAEYTNITFQQIQKYEMAKNRVSASRLYQFSVILKVDVDYFFKGYKPDEDIGLSDNGQEVFEYLDNKEKRARLREEKKVLDTYFSLDESQRKVALAMLKALSDK